jgi:hypothetical protein
MKDKFNTFFNKWVGKPCEVNDPSNLYQCMDLAYAWCDFLEVSRDAIRHLYALEIWTKPNDLTVKYFEMIPNTPLGVPQVGDIVVFKGGTSGHVSIANGIGDIKNFQSFDQNWGTTVGKCGIITHSYDDVLGFLRFRIYDPIITNQTIIPQVIDPNGKPMEVQAIISRMNDQERQITNQMMSMDALNSKISQLQEKLDNVPPLPPSAPVDASGEPILHSPIAKLLYSLAKRIG